MNVANLEYKSILYKFNDYNSYIVKLNIYREKLAWQEVQNIDIDIYYDEFLELYPKGKYFIEAQKRRASSSEYYESDSENFHLRYKNFLEKYPFGIFSSKIKDELLRIEDIKEKRIWLDTRNRDSLSEYKRFLFRNKNSKYIKNAIKKINEIVNLNEKNLWLRASKIHEQELESSGYEDYLIVYPNGFYAKEAKQKIIEIKKRRIEIMQKAYEEQPSHSLQFALSLGSVLPDDFVFDVIKNTRENLIEKGFL